MSWEEFRTRISQELGKRADVFRYRLGGQSSFKVAGSAFARSGNFFFSANELPERVRLLKQHLPNEVNAIIREADEICQHRFRLLGYENLDYGREIDWHLDIIHGKRTPLIPWYRIDFLNPDVAGDHKVTWELNRHQHLVTLSKAWLLTNDAKYADEAFAQWYSWQRANPYPLGVNWASTLEVAFRALSWLWMQNLLTGYSSAPATFADDLQQAFAVSGRYIERYFSTYFSPNTHLLGEAVALFFIGTLCPEIPAASQWKNKGWKITQEESHRQVRPDGVYFEQSLYYHIYALDFFLYARVLAARNQLEIPADYDAVLRKMLDVVQTLSQAGPPDGFGDDDGGRLFNPRRNRAEYMTDPLALGAAIFADVPTPSEITEESIWLFGPKAIAASSQATTHPPITSRCFPDGGLYIAASSKPSPQQIVIDAGPQGTGRSGHGHADALSLKFSFANRAWLIDPGTFVYMIPESERLAFRGTRAHNTLTIDGLGQANPDGPFAWNDIPTTHAELWIATENFAYFAGSHNGYERLSQPTRHRRLVFHLADAFTLVRDVIEGKGQHELETSWHFAPDLKISPVQNAFIASDGQTANSLTLLPSSDSQWQSVLESGYTSPAYGLKIPAQILRCRAQLTIPAEHAMLLIPSEQQTPTAGKFRRLEANSQPTSPAAIYVYEDSRLSHSVVFGPPKSSNWNFDVWATDAQVLYFRMRNGKLVHLICCEATSLDFRGKRIFSRGAKLQYLEWRNFAGERRVLSSDGALTNSLPDRAFDDAV